MAEIIYNNVKDSGFWELADTKLTVLWDERREEGVEGGLGSSQKYPRTHNGILTSSQIFFMLKLPMCSHVNNW